MQVVNLMETLGSAVKEEEVVEGMQAEDEHDHGDDEDHDKDEHDHDHDEEETEYDEHVWLSLKNAKVLVNGIADAMGKADPSNAASYKANAENYNKKLSDLDSKYEETVKSSGKNTVLFGDRFPFRYLTDDYGLKYYAAFVGCSAETEASFETIVFLSGKLDELGLKTVLVIDKSDKKIAQTVVNNTKTKDQEILVMDSLQSTSTSDSSKGVSYISVMEKNLEVLSKALA
jgi:zinc transport system substrate-binding protein